MALVSSSGGLGKETILIEVYGFLFLSLPSVLVTQLIAIPPFFLHYFYDLMLLTATCVVVVSLL